MRAKLVRDLDFNQNEIFEIKEAHHLINVLRVKKDDSLCLLNGNGLKGLTKIIEVSKKTIKVEVQSLEQVSRLRHIDIALGLPKKAYLEEMLTVAVELGVRSIFLFPSEYSQFAHINEKRLNQLLDQACEQSNNPFLPQIHKLNAKEDLFLENYSHKFLFSLNGSALKTHKKLESTNQYLLILGPEGGLSFNEEQWFEQQAQCLSVSLPTPILKARTALPTCFGWLLGHIND